MILGEEVLHLGPAPFSTNLLRDRYIWTPGFGYKDKKACHLRGVPPVTNTNRFPDLAGIICLIRWLGSLTTHLLIPWAPSVDLILLDKTASLSSCLFPASWWGHSPNQLSGSSSSAQTPGASLNCLIWLAVPSELLTQCGVYLLS